MRRPLTFALAVLGVGAFTIHTTAQQEEAVPETPVPTLKRSVAVFQFEDRSRGPAGVGWGMTDMLVTSLVKSGNFIVVERQEIESVLEEQGLGLAGAVTEESAAQVGRLLGVELAIFGSITHFGEDRRSVGLRKLDVGRARAKVNADVRFVNTTTGEIVYAESFEGTESGLGVVLDTEGIDFSSFEAWGNTRLGKAAQECANKIVRIASDHLADMPWHGTVLSVADDGPYCYIKPGSAGGLQRGNVLYVYRKGEELIDPDLGVSLGSEEKLIGKIQVLDPSVGDGKASRCLIIEGSGLERGDIVKIH